MTSMKIKRKRLGNVGKRRKRLRKEWGVFATRATMQRPGLYANERKRNVNRGKEMKNVKDEGERQR